MKFYRYEATEYATLGADGDFIRPMFPNPQLRLLEFNLHKETPKGYWIGYGIHVIGSICSPYSIWVSKTARKRYAYPSKQEAMNNFKARTNKRIKILEHQLLSCEISLAKAELENI